MTDAKDWHSHQYHVLEAVQQASRCPFCHLAVEGNQRYFETLLSDMVNDPGIRSQLRKSGGFCPRHAHDFASHRNLLGLSIIMKDIIMTGKEELDNQHSGKLKKHDWSRCPACVAQDHRESLYMDILADNIDDGRMLAAFKSGFGLCMPHLRKMLRRIRDISKRQIFLDAARKRVMNIENDLSEVIRKHDYLSSHESMGGQADAWMRATRFINGDRGVF